VQLGGATPKAFQHALEAFLRQQFDVFGEHREQAAHEKQRHLLRLMLLLEFLGDDGEAFGDVAGDFRRALGRVQCMRIVPHEFQARANILPRQIGEHDAERAPVRELCVILSLA